MRVVPSIPAPARSTTWFSRVALRWILVALHAAVGVAALQGAYGLVSDSWQMPTEWLERLPVDTWVLPGIALAVGVGGVQLFAAAAMGTGRPIARAISLAAGALLVAWIVGQVLVLMRFHPLQPAVAVIGIVEMLLAARLQLPATVAQTHAESLEEAA